ncbi:laminin subunit gamma-1-like isoform X1 [Diabrotica virgifera virgifera]|uniref:Laminin subunit gamma-1-like n=2 Tax=Diabrotica virgifera virgifera TaxID=50390 RepID=A0ABM5KZX4_DIAVI|nr:laminin subunit gamma-1-like isoform X1 [Diabrotica virgifera virgifera]
MRVMSVSFVVWIFICYVVGVSVLAFSESPVSETKLSKCYDDFNRPQRCIPGFENAAFNAIIAATNTCGQDGPSEYCEQTGDSKIRKSCDWCHPNQHHSQFMTDFHNQENPTWWQSETMLKGIQFPNQVNLTLKFGKAFDVTYIRIWFWSPRPESFFISKKTTEDGPWIPYQYYSATCRDTYGIPESVHTIRGEETRALCSSEYSDMSPLRGGNVAFGTLEGRPSAYNFDDSPELQEWVTATDIMITLDRLNTFRDEVFGDEKVLKSYFYAIADVAVGARCKCNGHASECVFSNRHDGHHARTCRCQHNTAGPDCNECLPFYNDVPWERATARNAYECKECNCNGYSNRCYFDQKLYEKTGHGGHCLDCIANRDGANCEKCRDNFYMRDDGFCTPCDCDRVGSRTLQCNSEGKCQCLPGVIGETCDRCQVNFYDFSHYGCQSCSCLEMGSAYNIPKCDSYSGTCYCKENVEGKRCQECKPGYFNLQYDNPFGCTPCFCYGHSSSCKSAIGYSKYAIESSFSRNNEKWASEDIYGSPSTIKYDSFTQSVGVRAVGEDIVYFVAPHRFLGDQRASYNQVLEFVLRIGDNRPVPSATDVIIEGNGESVTNTIFSQQNRLPSTQAQKFSFRLHEHLDYGWQPSLSPRAFISILTNITAIKIKGTYTPDGVGYLDDVKLETAVRGVAGEPAHWIESCDCPTGYIGQFCESCAPGYRHSAAFGDPFLPCVPCDCNNHASICDSETGKCICQHNTVGENCQFCARGYYGNALKGTVNDCQPCDCPNNGPCLQIDDNTVMCTECSTGYNGPHCDVCADGYFGDPTGRYGDVRPCQPCQCNKNIDTNAIGNCNTTTGECLKCIFNTGGSKCEVCLPGFYGNALVLPKGDCKRCECHLPGTETDVRSAELCDQTTGTCQCKNHVVGRNCDKCENGYFDLHSGNGCQSCNCDLVGSVNQTCDAISGRCYCRPGVTGLRCDRCETKHYGFSTEGCKRCECDPLGSVDLQCDDTGQCFCFDNVDGKKCDRCKENKYDRQRGCIDCPECYNLVQNSLDTHTDKLDQLEQILDDIENQPTVIPDEEFPDNLNKVKDQIADLHKNVTQTFGDQSSVLQLKEIEEDTEELHKSVSDIQETLDTIKNNNLFTTNSLNHIDDLLNEASEKMEEIEGDIVLRGKTSLKEAQERATIAGDHSEKMTTISQDARDLAQNLEQHATNIKNAAEKAKIDSTEAYKLVKNAVGKQAHLMELIRYLKVELEKTEQQLYASKEWTKEVSEKAHTVKKNALTLFTEVENLNIPKLNIEDFKQKSDELKQKAILYRARSGIVFKESEDLKKDVEKQIKLGMDLIQQAIDQQEELNDLRNDLVLYESQEKIVINLWNEIWSNAENNYKLLKEFDTQTKKSKEDAEAALKSVKNVESIIDDVFKQMKSYDKELDQAKNNADVALEKAQQANVLAKNASVKACEIKHESELLYKNSTALVEEAGLMFDRVQNTEGELKILVQKTKSNTSLINEVKEKVGRAEKDTEEVSNKVRHLLSDIENIMYELQNSPGIDETDVDRLEEQIKITEEKIKAAKLDEKLQRLQDDKKMKDELIERYKKQIILLQDEVDNIEQVVDALPSGCYRRIELEP